MMGAILYRLKIIYSVLIFAIIPIGAIAYAANYGFRNPDKTEAFGLEVINTLAFLMENQDVAIIIKFIGIVIFSIVGVRLLTKAPIKEYAHDLV